MTATPTARSHHARCARHGDVAAAFRCCECGEHLCHDCVELGSHLIICRLCGERALELDELDRPGIIPPGASRPSPRSLRPEPVAPRQDRSKASREPRLDADPGVFLVDHVVVPAAVIAMVAALLFFLFDVRSVFLGDSAALKQVGFCFVAATVLIARYGHAGRHAGRQGLYTLALAAATVLVVLASPWETPDDAPEEPLVNLVILLMVWRFATRLTAGLSLAGSSAGPPPAEERLYGVERLKLEAWRREHSEERSEKPRPMPANPGVAVAKLAVAGLVVFALGEPFLLSGPPAAGERALTAMIVFLFATGMVLAAGSGVGTLRQVRAAGGEVSASVLPGQLAAAALVMVTILALALAMPGVEVRGSGARQPRVEDGRAGGDDPGETQRRSGDRAAEDGRTGGEDPDDATRGSGDEAAEGVGERGVATREPGDGAAEGRDAVDGGQGDEGRSRDRRVDAPAAPPPLTGFLAELGRWLRIPFLLAVAALALYGLWRTRSRLGTLGRRLLDRLHELAARLAAGFGRLLRRRGKAGETLADPLADLDALRRAEPRQAVLAAYGRLLAVFDRLEHRRGERQTPYEFLASVPAGLKSFKGPARDLTEVYVKAAYSAAPVAAADRRRAIAALEEIGKVWRLRGRL